VVTSRELFKFGGTSHISGTAKDRVIEVCTRVGYIKSQYMDEKSPLNGAWSGSRDPF